MSKTIDPSDAPIPWLKQEGNTSTAQEPPWGTPAERQVFLGMRHHPTRQDHWHCLNRVVWVRPAMSIIYFGIFGGGLMGGPITPLVNAAITSLVSGYWSVPPINGRSLLARIVVNILVLILGKAVLTLWFVSTEMAKRAAEMKRERNLLLTSEGIEEAVAEKTTTILWEKVVAIVEESGSLYLLGTKIEEGFYIPRSAFGSREAAQRFRAAATNLWKSQGNPVSITPEVYEEFKPQESV